MRNGKSQIKKNKKGERVAEGDGKRAKKLTLAPPVRSGSESLKGGFADLEGKTHS